MRCIPDQSWRGSQATHSQTEAAAIDTGCPHSMYGRTVVRAWWRPVVWDSGFRMQLNKDTELEELEFRTQFK